MNSPLKKSEVLRQRLCYAVCASYLFCSYFYLLKDALAFSNRGVMAYLEKNSTSIF